MRHPFLNTKRLSLTEPQAWTVIAGLLALIVLASWMLDQGLGIAGGLIGIAAAIGARWFVTHPLIEHVYVEAWADAECEPTSPTITQSLLQALGKGASAIYANPATRRYKSELEAIGRGFDNLIQGSPLDTETQQALTTLHVADEDPYIALCRAFTRIVSFNFDPDWSDDSRFDANGHHLWPEDGEE